MANSPKKGDSVHMANKAIKINDLFCRPALSTNSKEPTAPRISTTKDKTRNILGLGGSATIDLLE